MFISEIKFQSLVLPSPIAEKEIKCLSLYYNYRSAKGRGDGSIENETSFLLEEIHFS